MAELTFETSDPQADFLDLKTRYQGFIGGVGSGKTWSGALKTLVLALERPGSTGLIGARTYPMLRDVVIPVIQEVWPEELIQDFNRNEGIMTLVNGTTVLFRSLEGERQIDRLRGLTLNWFWIDEAAYLPAYAFKVLRARLREGTNHVGVITTTPKGFDWIWEGFVQEGHAKRYSAVTGISSDSNPFLPADYLEDLKAAYSGEFLKQEFYGQFVKFEGLVYVEFGHDTHILSISQVSEMLQQEGVTWRYGYDAGFTNPRVLLQLVELPGGEVILVNEFYQRRALLSTSIPAFQELQEGRPGTIFADPSAKGEIEEMRAAGLSIQAANNDVAHGIQVVKALLSSGKLLISEQCQMTINELNSYHWDETKDKPVKEMDHSMDALRYALASKGRPVRMVKLDIFGDGKRRAAHRGKVVDRLRAAQRAEREDGV